jgi:hypothetical protein
VSAPSNKASRKDPADSEQQPAAEPDEQAGRVKLWEPLAGAALALVLVLLSLGAVGAVALGVVWFAEVAERYLGLGSLEAAVAFVGVALVVGLLIGASRIAEAVHTAIREQTALLYELQDTLDRHADQVRELSEELGEADVLPELRRHGRARRRAGR